MASRAAAPARAAMRSLARPARRTLTPSFAMPTPLLRPQTLPAFHPAVNSSLFARHAHNIPRPPPPSLPEADAKSTDSTRTGLAPHYELTLTCVPCGTRSAHNISKQGYHHGSVLITCPSCRNRHVISDHLGIFGQAGQKQSLEQIMAAKGQLVKRGTLGEDGDVEFWEDGTSSGRAARLASEDVMLPAGKTSSDKAEGGGESGDAPGSTFK